MISLYGCLANHFKNEHGYSDEEVTEALDRIAENKNSDKQLTLSEV